MTPTQATSPSDVLQLWFGELDAEGLSDQEHTRSWWRKDADFDADLRTRFGQLHPRCMAGLCDLWLATPTGRLAVVIVLDQFSRNMFRDSANMFAADALALRFALEGIDRGEDASLRTAERVFLYMPLMHSESLEAQDRCVGLFSAFCQSLSGSARKAIEANLDFAQRHRDIIARFGRFPHRNALLGRTSSAEETAFLSEPGSSF